MDRPFAPVSVIIPCFQCQNSLRRALKSIERQSVLPSQIIIVNDGNSPDEKNAIIKICKESSLSEKITIIHFDTQRGPGAARNAGWEKAEENYVAFLDADDAWHRRKIEIQYHWMKNNPDIVLSAHQIVDATFLSSMPSLKCKWYASKIQPARALISNPVFTQTVMLRRDIHLRFDSTKKYSEDYLLWLEIILNKFKVICIHLPLAFIFKPVYGAGGLSGHIWQMEMGEINTYIKLYKKGFFSVFLLNGLIMISVIKFFKRLLVSKILCKRGKFYWRIPIIKTW